VLEVQSLSLPGVFEILPKRFADDRGFFSETYSAAAFERLKLPVNWVQDNQSLSHKPGTVRGLHFQRPPMAQAKLVSVIAGEIFDVVVDLRRTSPTRGLWAAVRLSAERGNQLFVPTGFAHGFMTLEANTQVSYKVNAPYSPEHERSIRFDDAAIGIEWPDLARVVLSEKDAAAPPLTDVETGF